MPKVVGVSDMLVSKNPDDVIVTHSLGSCIGVAVYDPAAGVGGLLHYQLPLSRDNPERALNNPYMFADTGVPALFRACYELGASKQRMIVKIAGGSTTLDTNGFFNIGQRNYITLRKILWKNGVLIAAEDIGGNSWRTMFLSVGTGSVRLKTNRGEFLL